MTAEFLKKRGYTLEDEVMASRVVTVPDAERKHELSDSGHTLEEFYAGEERTPLWDSLSHDLMKRSFENFTIMN